MSQELSPLQNELFNRADLIFGAIKDATIAAKDFALEQLPDVAQQFIVYSRISYSVHLLLSVGLILTSVWCWKRFKSELARDGDPMLEFMCGITTGIFGTVAFVINLKPFLMVWFAPKIFLIIEITNLIKS